MKVRFLILTILLATFGLFLVSAYAHGPAYYGDEDVKTEVKKIDKGIQITITSEEPEIATDLQEHTRWYKRIFEMGNYCPMMGYIKYSHSRHHSCM